MNWVIAFLLITVVGGPFLALWVIIDALLIKKLWSKW